MGSEENWDKKLLLKASKMQRCKDAFLRMNTNVYGNNLQMNIWINMCIKGF